METFLDIMGKIMPYLATILGGLSIFGLSRLKGVIIKAINKYQEKAAETPSKADDVFADLLEDLTTSVFKRIDLKKKKK